MCSRKRLLSDFSLFAGAMTTLALCSVRGVGEGHSRNINASITIGRRGGEGRGYYQVLGTSPAHTISVLFSVLLSKMTAST